MDDKFVPCFQYNSIYSCSMCICEDPGPIGIEPSQCFRKANKTAQVHNHENTSDREPSHYVFFLLWLNLAVGIGEVLAKKELTLKLYYILFQPNLLSIPNCHFFFFCTFQLFSYFSLLTLPSNVKHTHIPQIEYRLIIKHCNLFLNCWHSTFHSFYGNQPK